MQKLHYLLFFLLLPFTLLAQKRTKITLVNSQHSTVDLKSNISYLRKPVFQQDNAILRCDSAVFFEARNVFEAYNNVHINQADTVNIYSDRLTYDGNTKMAHLSSNVRLLDRTSVLTTNILDYNMNTKVGTYVEGGKIVSKGSTPGNDVTVTSKNGYYFANSRDAYFRYNVVVVSPEVKILSDTMRYNTLNNWTYFYGPTNIKGKDDNLYTENGAYNTKSEYAYFGRKNLYTSGSKSLKGDSLYYDGVAGYGKAVRNIVFSDTVDRTVLYGQLGYYYKADERALVTKNPYVGMGKDSVKVNDVLRPDTLWLGADTLETQMVLRQTLKLIPRPVIKKDNEIGSDTPEGGEDPKAARRKQRNGAAQESAAGKAGAVGKAPGRKEEDAALDNPPKGTDSTAKRDSTVRVSTADSTAKPDSKAKLDSKAKQDSVAKQTAKAQSDSTAKLNSAARLDSTARLSKLNTDSLKQTRRGKPDSLTQVINKKGDTLKTVVAKDSLKNKVALKPGPVLNPSDTVKVRTIKAYHNVRVYKSNLQAKSDSLFYNSADSTLRWFHNPIMWGEGSQQTGDTIYLQMRNSKLSSVQVLQTAFSVNVEKDTAHFNQVKGKVMTGFFKEGKIQSLYVDGNAESIYHTKDDKNVYKEMNQTVSSRLKITFKDDEIADMVTIKEAESAITPLSKLKEDVFLTGFIWKPELRPLSKRDITNPKARKINSSAKRPAPPKKKTGDAEKEDLDEEESGVKRTEAKSNAADSTGTGEKKTAGSAGTVEKKQTAAAEAKTTGSTTGTALVKKGVKDSLPADKTAVSGTPAVNPGTIPATKPGTLPTKPATVPQAQPPSKPTTKPPRSTAAKRAATPTANQQKAKNGTLKKKPVQ